MAVIVIIGALLIGAALLALAVLPKGIASSWPIPLSNHSRLAK